MTTNYRFALQRYTNPASRYTCRGCGERREMTRYLDTLTGELLPEEFGKCNRTDKCGYHVSPYQIGTGGISYAKQMREAERADAWKRPAGWHQASTSLVPSQTTKLSLRPVISIPSAVMQATLGHYQHNELARLLNARLGAGVASELMVRFNLGTSMYWQGACVFWLIDEKKRVRGGQIVLLDKTGHTVKRPKRCTTWAHTALAAHARRTGQSAPAWLKSYSDKTVPKSPCLFGLPQLATAPVNQPVAIVESAKTAIICSAYWPNYVWLATMSKDYLTLDRIAPLKGHPLFLFPDAGALNNWQVRAEKLRKEGFKVNVSTHLESTVTPEQLADGYDIADVLLSRWKGYPPSWDERG